jgi:membrane-bound lytic murein transglycosylase B
MMESTMRRHRTRHSHTGQIAAIATFAAAGAVVAVIALAPGNAPHRMPDPAPPRPQTAVVVPLPPANPLLPANRPAGGVGIAQLADPGWVATVASASGIPRRALEAYAGATIAKAAQMPQCALGWTTLAGIGFAESDHGRHGGSQLRDDGTVDPPIYGVALDGEGTAHVPDSDSGAIDGDAAADRAVGPMQLIPQAWRNWHVDAGGDGVEDPQNIDDAVTAAANYLCRASADMSGAEGWRAGIAAYNASGVYRQTVADAANRYAASVLRALSPG